MNTQYTAVVKQDGAWWIGWIEEVPGVNCQEQTYQELIELGYPLDSSGHNM